MVFMLKYMDLSRFIVFLCSIFILLISKIVCQQCDTISEHYNNKTFKEHCVECIADAHAGNYDCVNLEFPKKQELLYKDPQKVLAAFDRQKRKLTIKTDFINWCGLIELDENLATRGYSYIKQSMMTHQTHNRANDYLGMDRLGKSTQIINRLGKSFNNTITKSLCASHLTVMGSSLVSNHFTRQGIDMCTRVCKTQLEKILKVYPTTVILKDMYCSRSGIRMASCICEFKISCQVNIHSVLIHFIVNREGYLAVFDEEVGKPYLF